MHAGGHGALVYVRVLHGRMRDEESEVHEEKEETTESEKESEEIGSYDGHSVTIRLAKGKYIVEDNGKETMEDGKTRDDGRYEAAMYL